MIQQSHAPQPHASYVGFSHPQAVLGTVIAFIAIQCAAFGLAHMDFNNAVQLELMLSPLLALGLAGVYAIAGLCSPVEG